MQSHLSKHWNNRAICKGMRISKTTGQYKDKHFIVRSQTWNWKNSLYISKRAKICQLGNNRITLCSKCRINGINGMWYRSSVRWWLTKQFVPFRSKVSHLCPEDIYIYNKNKTSRLTHPFRSFNGPVLGAKLLRARHPPTFYALLWHAQMAFIFVTITKNNRLAQKFLSTIWGRACSKNASSPALPQNFCNFCSPRRATVHQSAFCWWYKHTQ